MNCASAGKQACPTTSLFATAMASAFARSTSVNWAICESGSDDAATGAGGGLKAGKDQVLAAVIRRYPDVPVDGNDQADALVRNHHRDHPA